MLMITIYVIVFHCIYSMNCTEITHFIFASVANAKCENKKTEGGYLIEILNGKK